MSPQDDEITAICASTQDELAMLANDVRRGRLDRLADRFGAEQADLLARCADGADHFWIGTGTRARLDVLETRRGRHATVATVRVQVPARGWVGPTNLVVARVISWYLRLSATLMSRPAPEGTRARHLIAHWMFGFNTATGRWEFLEADR